MVRVRCTCLLLALGCLFCLPCIAHAAEVDCDSTYCFSTTDFSNNETLSGICITQLPDAAAGTVMLGSRVIRPGDILTAEQVGQMSFNALRTEQDLDAVVTYLPIYESRVDPSATMTISIRGKTDKAPIAKDSTLETYKNLPNNGKLSAEDPEGEDLVFTVIRQPKRGELTVADDGTFTYTPRKNKVGVDSFTFTAADPAGNVSQQATVTVQILKPSDSRRYTDTVGQDCRFAAEWMRNTGLFVGEKIGDSECFQPDKTVSRGEFLTLVVKALDVPTQSSVYTALPTDTPDWVKPYLAAAVRAGLTDGLPVSETGSFGTEQPITGAEAAVILQNALDLSISQQTLETVMAEASNTQAEEIPAWAAFSLTAMQDNGISLNAGEALNRSTAAQVMYQVSQLAIHAPGMQVIRMQQ